MIINIDWCQLKVHINVSHRLINGIGWLINVDYYWLTSIHVVYWSHRLRTLGINIHVEMSWRKGDDCVEQYRFCLGGGVELLNLSDGVVRMEAKKILVTSSSLEIHSTPPSRGVCTMIALWLHLSPVISTPVLIFEKKIFLNFS